MIKTLSIAGVAFFVCFAAAALAIEPTRTPLVAPETGENSLGAGQITDVARLKVGTGTGTAVSNAVTINKGSGIITTESLTTAAGATQAITLTDSKIQAGDMVLATVDPATSAGTPTVASVAVSASTAVILVQNIHASAALNAAIKIMFLVVTKGNPN